MELKEYLFRKGISATEFALLLDCSRGHTNELKNKRRRPSKKLAKKIHEITKGEVSIRELLTVREDNLIGMRQRK